MGKGLSILAFSRYVKKEQREVKRELMLITKEKMEGMSTATSGSDSSKNWLIPISPNCTAIVSWSHQGGWMVSHGAHSPEKEGIFSPALSLYLKMTLLS